MAYTVHKVPRNDSRASWNSEVCLALAHGLLNISRGQGIPVFADVML